MKRIAAIIVLICALAPITSMGQNRPHITLAVAVNHRVGQLQWQGDTISQYAIYRRYPSDEDFALIDSIMGNAYTDTLNRVVCADTVSYFVQDLQSMAISDTTGVVYRDDVPTSPCSLKVCSTDQELNQIVLSWYPSPDEDVMGYYICMGNPCLDYDTVWGKENCTYLCPQELANGLIPERPFRILAFDSCMQASPLTPYYHNPVLEFDNTPCSRHFKCRWNRYINMPDSVGAYRLHYRLEGEEEERVFSVGNDGPYEFDLVVNDLSVGQVETYLSVENSSGTLQAVSQRYVFEFMVGDTAENIAIADIEYDATLPAINLTVELDPDFAGNSCTLYRSKGNDAQFEPIAELTRTAGEAQLHYQDNNIHRSAGSYTYMAGVWDLCQQVEKLSDTLAIELPEVYDANAYFANALRYGDPDNGSFCPHLASPLAQGYEMNIFNRMGECVFNTKNIAECWNGTYEGNALPQGTYIYRVHCHHADGTEKTYIGTILLIK
ncbi:MAG: gliding motility-associated C-terminal domain-containing protein [Bacteroidales bacterium]|nr:gliding motility-associated C-terminal domain-containing protein [Candidatus Colimorpha merdihippi]